MIVLIAICVIILLLLFAVIPGIVALLAMALTRYLTGRR